MSTLDSLVIGAGQAGLSSFFHLSRLGISHVVLDSGDRPGGASQHRWDALTMRDVHGVAEMPADTAPAREGGRANVAILAYFAAYEQKHALPVIRPVKVDRVEDQDGFLVVRAQGREWKTRTGALRRQARRGGRRGERPRFSSSVLSPRSPTPSG